MCIVLINLCKIMQDSKSRAITQTIDTNLVSLFCDAGYVQAGWDFPHKIVNSRDSADLSVLVKKHLHATYKQQLG